MMNSNKFFKPSKHRRIKKLEKEINSSIWETVQQRREQCSKTSSSDKDLLQLIMDAAMTESSLPAKQSSKNFIVDNCKTMYFSGHETTAVSAAWSLMLLALHPNWQDRIRSEFAHTCPDGRFDLTSISQLKSVNYLSLTTEHILPCV